MGDLSALFLFCVAYSAFVLLLQGLVKASKKGKAGKSAGFSADLDDPELEAEAEAEAAPSKQKGKKKQKGRKAAIGFAALEDEDVEPADSVLRTESVPDEEELASVAESKTRKPKKGKKQADTGSAFAALGVDDVDIEAESHAESAHDLDEAEEAPVAAPKGKTRKGKKKQFDTASAFAALGVDDDDNEETAAAFEPPVEIEEAGDEPEAAPKAKSKKGKKKQIDTASAFAALGLDDDETEQTAEAAEPPVVALADDAPVSAPPRKSKKGKKGGVDAASAFAALGLEDDAESGDGGHDASTGAPAVADVQEEVFGKTDDASDVLCARGCLKPHQMFVLCMRGMHALVAMHILVAMQKG